MARRLTTEDVLEQDDFDYEPMMPVCDDEFSDYDDDVDLDLENEEDDDDASAAHSHFPPNDADTSSASHSHLTMVTLAVPLTPLTMLTPAVPLNPTSLLLMLTVAMPLTPSSLLVMHQAQARTPPLAGHPTSHQSLSWLSAYQWVTSPSHQLISWTSCLHQIFWRTWWSRVIFTLSK